MELYRLLNTSARHLSVEALPALARLPSVET